MIPKVFAFISICALFLKDSADVTIDKLMLSEKDIPTGYAFTNESRCISIQACTFYDKPDIYEMLIGTVKSKQIQNFDNKKDNGAVMYFEFEDDFKGDGFLGGLLWGGSKPSKDHPEEFYSKGKFLVIWNFKKGSPLVKLSQEKVKTVLNQ